MTVADLLAALQGCDPETTVFVWGDDDWIEAEEVEVRSREAARQGGGWYPPTGYEKAVIVR